MSPKKPAEIYPFIIHFIFAVVIATSYPLTTKIFITPDVPFFSSINSLTPSFEILLIYALIISGWVGYSRAMLKWPHTNTKGGTFRFLLDLAILFCYSSLILSINQTDIFERNLTGWFVTIFILFTIWDFTKMLEHRKKGVSHAMAKSFWITIAFTLIFTLPIPFLFDYLLNNQIGIINTESIYILKLLLFTITIIFYRRLKWSIPAQSRSK